MKTGSFISMTSGLAVLCLSALLLVAFVDEASAKPPSQPKKPAGGCGAYGHSCYGGHGKRSMPDDANDRFDSVEADRDSSNLREDFREPSDNALRRVLSGDEIQQVQDLIARRNRAIEASRRHRVERNPLPDLINQWLNSQRRAYNDDSERDDK